MKNNNSIKDVVVVGGGTAGWFAASLLMKVLGKSISITLVESEQIGTVGVGEATIPPIINFNNALGIDEATFLKETKGTIKLGIQFENWGQQGESYMHAFGGLGQDFPFCDFHHFWVRSQQLGIKSGLWDFSLNYQTAIHNKFGKLDGIEGTNIKGLAYAYHFDATLYAKLLRKYSEDKGVKRIEGLIADTNIEPESGLIESLTLQNGEQISGDLFIDCSGFRGLLIEQAMSTGYEDWTHWLPCDKAVAVQSDYTGEITPYTRSIAHAAGWQWRIPLQHRVGNGLVYSSKYYSDEQAQQLLLDNIDGKPVNEPRVIPFRTGRRRKQWNGNCVSLGLASGFLEPLESTSIHLVQAGVLRLIKHFPHAGINQAEIDEYNRQSKKEFEQVRDFIILHYHLNQRQDSEFWQACQRMDIPDSLQEKIDLFSATGKVFREQEALFAEIAWQQVMIGQGIIPKDFHPIAGGISEEQLKDFLGSVKTIINGAVNKLPSHEEFISQYRST